MLLIIILILLLLIFSTNCVQYIKKGSLFINSFTRGMEISEFPSVKADKLDYFDNTKPIYYNFIPEVEPMI